jgi:energy-coupling factor transport system permease protein
LVEHLHAPRRFTVGALAAFRLMPLFADEWQTIALARRARGLDNRRVTAFFSMTRSLLVAAIRRATRLAIAMDGRGFADPGCRTLARPRRIKWHDRSLIAAAVVVAASASVVSMLLGMWRFFLSA